MQCNVIRNGDVLTVDTFNDLIKYGNRTAMSTQSKTCRYEKIHKIIIKNSKCKMTIDAIKSCLKNIKVFDELKEIEIVMEDDRFCTVDGMLYSKNKRRLYFCPRGKEGELVIPEETNTITEYACSNCAFSTVIIPNSVKQIGRFAFARSYALEEVRGCKKIEKICDYAFAYCKFLKKFSFGEFIKSIGACAFEYTMLTEIYLPEGIYRVGRLAFNTGRLAFNTIWIDDGDSTFAGPSQMYDIHIPSTLKDIGPYAFANAANVYTTFVNAELIHAGTGNGNLEHCHECNTWKLKIDGKPDVIVPKTINASSHAAKIANKINATFGLIKNGKLQTDKADNVVSEAVIPPELYQYSSDSTGMTAVLEQCRKYPNSSLKRFITKNISIIFYNLIDSPTSRNGEEIMVSLIKDGVFTDTALKKLLEEIEQSAKKDSLITLKAYAMDTIKHKNNSFTI